MDIWLFITLGAFFFMIALFIITTAIIMMTPPSPSRPQHHHHNDHKNMMTGPSGIMGPIGPTGATNDNINDPKNDFPFQPTFTNVLALSNVTGFGSNISYDRTLTYAWGSVLDYTSGPNFNNLWIAVNGNDIATGGLNKYALSLTGNNDGLTGSAPFIPSLTLLNRVVIDDFLTGVDMNITGAPGGFVIHNISGQTGPALLVTVSEQGNIWAYNPLVGPPVQMIHNTTGNYKSCCFDHLGKLWVTNWNSFMIEIYNSQWQLINQVTDVSPTLSFNGAGFAPYGLLLDSNNQTMTCSFAFQDGQNRPIAGPGNLFISKFNPLTMQFITRINPLLPITSVYGMLAIAMNTIIPNVPFPILGLVNTDGQLQLIREEDGQFLINTKDVYGNGLTIPGALSITRMPVSNFGITGVNAVALITSNRYNGYGSFVNVVTQVPRIYQD